MDRLPGGDGWKPTYMQRPCLTRNEIDDSQDAMDRLPGGDKWKLAYMQCPCLTRNEIDDSQDAMDRLPGGDGRDLARIRLVPHLVGNPVNHQQSLSTK